MAVALSGPHFGICRHSPTFTWIPCSSRVGYSKATNYTLSNPSVNFWSFIRTPPFLLATVSCCAEILSQICPLRWLASSVADLSFVVVVDRHRAASRMRTFDFSSERWLLAIRRLPLCLLRCERKQVMH